MNDFLETQIPHVIIERERNKGEINIFENWGPLGLEIIKRALDPNKTSEFRLREKQDPSRPRERVTVWTGNSTSMINDIGEVRVQFCNYIQEPILRVYLCSEGTRNPIHGPINRTLSYEIGRRFLLAPKEGASAEHEGAWSAVIRVQDRRVKSYPRLTTEIGYVNDGVGVSVSQQEFAQYPARHSPGDSMYDTAEIILGSPLQYVNGIYGSGVEHEGPRYGEKQVKFSFHRSNILSMHLPLIVRGNTISISEYWLQNFWKMSSLWEKFLVNFPNTSLSDVLYDSFFRDTKYENMTALLARLGEMLFVVEEQIIDHSTSLGVDSSIPLSIIDICHFLSERETSLNKPAVSLLPIFRDTGT